MAKKNSTHYIGISGLSDYMPDYCEAYESAQDAIDSLLDMIEIDEKTAIIVDRAGLLETKICDSRIANLRQYRDSARFDVYMGRDIITQLNDQWWADLPIEGNAHPVFGSEYLEVTECNCSDPSIHSGE